MNAALATFTSGQTRALELQELGVTGQDAIAPLARFEASIEETIPVAIWPQFRADLDLISSDEVAAGVAQFGRRGLTDPRLQQFAAACRATNSFSGDTLVSMAHGGSVPIADVQVGDQVLAYDFDTGVTVAREVSATLPHTDWLLEAHFSDGTTMSVTEDHRFWSATDADWVELQDLDPDDVLLSPDGATVTVDWLDWDAGVTTDAYDLTVDQEHNFFVSADTTGQPVLVHNQTLRRFACGATVSADTFVRIAAAEDALDAASRVRLASVADTLSRVVVPDTVGGTRSLLDVFVEQLEPVTSAAELRRVLAGASFGPNVTSAALSTGRAVDILGHPRFIEAAASSTPDALARRIATPELEAARIDAVRTADTDFANLGIDNDTIIDRWRVYPGTLDADAWLDAYVRVRKSSFSGSAFERAALEAAGVNLQTARRPLFDFTSVGDPGQAASRGGFVPDNARALAADGTEFAPPAAFDHWRFTEVKNLNSGPVTAGNSSNTASQLEWLLRQEPGPSGIRGELDLYVGENTTFTRPFLDLVRRARERGVEVRLFREQRPQNPSAPVSFEEDLSF